jgi:hypothetical protein
MRYNALYEPAACLPLAEPHAAAKVAAHFRKCVHTAVDCFAYFAFCDFFTAADYNIIVIGSYKRSNIRRTVISTYHIKHLLL